MSDKLCRHCDKTTNLNGILCDECSKKALQVLPSDPEERVHIYRILLESENPITRYAAEQLIKDDLEEIEQQFFNLTDYDSRSE